MTGRICGLIFLLAIFAFSQNVYNPKMVAARISNEKRIEPSYSEQARRDHISGTVKLRVIVGPDGHVRDIEVIRGLGFGLDENAVKAVRTWEFEPATRDGIPVEEAVPVDCQFHTL